jgi:DNA repair ATPase RecN
LEEQARAYRVNQYEIDTLRTRTTALDEREQKLTDQEKLHARAEEVLVKKLNNAKQLYDRQKNVNQLLEQSENKVSSLSALNGSLRAQLAERDKTISELQERLETALQNVRGAYESLTNVVKAVGMLKYDKEHVYGVNLTEKQGRLIDALARYGAGWAMKDGHPDLAKAMNEQIGISQSIQEDIKALTPKISRGRGL